MTNIGDRCGLVAFNSKETFKKAGKFGNDDAEERKHNHFTYRIWRPRVWAKTSLEWGDYQGGSVFRGLQLYFGADVREQTRIGLRIWERLLILGHEFHGEDRVLLKWIRREANVGAMSLVWMQQRGKSYWVDTVPTTPCGTKRALCDPDTLEVIPEGQPA